MPICERPTEAGKPTRSTGEIESLVERAFGVPFAILDCHSGELLHANSAQPARDWDRLAEVCREVSRRGNPELIDDEDPLLTLALPLPAPDARRLLAVATFVARPIADNEDLSVPARLLGMAPAEALRWARRQTPWPAETLQRMAGLVMESVTVDHQFRASKEQCRNLSASLASTYEELGLLHRLTQNLKISRSDEDLGRLAMKWMREVVPAEGLAIQLVPVASAEKSIVRPPRSRSLLLSCGRCPVDADQFSALVVHFGPNAHHHPIVANRSTTELPGWPCPRVRQVVAVALAAGENVFGWLAALNHLSDTEFGQREARLLSSVAAILGIHSGNIELYRQQSELLAGVARALTSAVDAKDPYTCGHSDRVARVAVRLAQELGCEEKTLDTLYLAGLLHDVGKIGINDNVLRKAGKLSSVEYEHIKQHTEIGYRILHELSKLEDVLPVVLHHHESWNGGGYPHQLGCEGIPLAARIVAVADAFDAMISDRPYRQGMPEQQVAQILRDGAGHQWDPEVVDAFFRSRQDIHQICQQQQPQPSPHPG